MVGQADTAGSVLESVVVVSRRRAWWAYKLLVWPAVAVLVYGLVSDWPGGAIVLAAIALGAAAVVKNLGCDPVLVARMPSGLTATTGAWWPRRAPDSTPVPVDAASVAPAGGLVNRVYDVGGARWAVSGSARRRFEAMVEAARATAD